MSNDAFMAGVEAGIEKVAGNGSGWAKAMARKHNVFNALASPNEATAWHGIRKTMRAPSAMQGLHHFHGVPQKVQRKMDRIAGAGMGAVHGVAG